MLKALSNRADMVSDGDALIELVLPTGVAVGDVSFDLNGSDVTSAFDRRSNGRVMGVVSGLKVGDNLLTAKLKGKNSGVRLAITNSARGGNIFAGVPIQPWVCARVVATAVTVSQPGTNLSGTATTRASGLDSDPIDEDCNAPTKYTYYYQPKSKDLQGIAAREMAPRRRRTRPTPAERRPRWRHWPGRSHSAYESLLH